MSLLLSLLSDLPRPIAEITHIGAGSGSNLSDYLATDAAHILLVEAEADAAAKLRAKTAHHPKVTVVHASVSANPKPRPFYHVSFSDLSSLRAPAKLREQFPGLRILTQETVTPITPESLLAGIETEPTGSRLLMIEAPGEALGILQSLAKAELLQRYDIICLQEALAPLYEGATPAQKIRDFLSDASFVTLFSPNSEDPNRPHLIARLDQASIEREAQLATLSEERDAAQAETAALKSELDSARQEIAALTKAQEQSNTTQKTQTQRLNQYREEMIKTEGQIKLLCDLLLNGNAL